MKKALLMTAGLLWAQPRCAPLDQSGACGHAVGWQVGHRRLDHHAGGITLEPSADPIRLPGKPKDDSREATVHEQGRSRPGRSLYPPGISSLQLATEGEDRRRQNTECRPEPGKSTAPGKQVPVHDRRQCVDQVGYRDYSCRRTSRRQSPRRSP